MITLEIDLTEDELIALGCVAMHRAGRARKALYAGDFGQAAINYYGLDLAELSNFAAAIQGDLVSRIVAAAKAAAEAGIQEGK